MPRRGGKLGFFFNQCPAGEIFGNKRPTIFGLRFCSQLALSAKTLLRAARFDHKKVSATSALHFLEFFCCQLAKTLLRPARFARQNLTTGGAKKAYCCSETLTAHCAIYQLCSWYILEISIDIMILLLSYL